jgi:hypothetical protein
VFQADPRVPDRCGEAVRGIQDGEQVGALDSEPGGGVEHLFAQLYQIREGAAATGGADTCTRSVHSNHPPVVGVDAYLSRPTSYGGVPPESRRPNDNWGRLKLGTVKACGRSGCECAFNHY